jgi:hypothetical protein
LKEDVLEYLKKISTVSDTRTAPESRSAAVESKYLASVTRSLVTSDYAEPIQGFRKAMVKSMTNSWVRSTSVYA